MMGEVVPVCGCVDCVFGVVGSVRLVFDFLL